MRPTSELGDAVLLDLDLLLIRQRHVSQSTGLDVGEHIGLGIVCGVGTDDGLSEAVGTELFGYSSDPVQAFGFETESTARAKAA